MFKEKCKSAYSPKIAPSISGSMCNPTKEYDNVQKNGFGAAQSGHKNGPDKNPVRFPYFLSPSVKSSFALAAKPAKL